MSTRRQKRKATTRKNKTPQNFTGLETLEQRTLMSASLLGADPAAFLQQIQGQSAIIELVQNEHGTQSMSRSVSTNSAVYDSLSATGETSSTLTWGGVNGGTSSGLTIELNMTSVLENNTPARDAFLRAAHMWELMISDPITVTINADLSNIGNANIIGQTSSVLLVGGYDLVRDMVVADIDNENDDAIVASLPTSSEASFRMPRGARFDGGLGGTKASLKAAGFTGLDDPDTGFGATDGTITFNSTFSFDFNNTVIDAGDDDFVDSSKMDFETVAAHEIGHALGFVSIVDYLDSYKGAVSPYLMDMFRFKDGGSSSDPTTPQQFTDVPRDLRPGQTAITDQIGTWGDSTTEMLMSTGSNKGDGSQASHFKDDLHIGIMDPTLSLGEISPITHNDLRVFDLIGWDIEEPGAVPPTPATPPAPDADAASTTEDLDINISVLANDDPDENNTPFSLTDVPATSLLGATLNDNGDGTINYDPASSSTLQALGLTDPADMDTDTFTYTVTDDEGDTATATVTITVTGANDAPTADLTQNFTVTEGDTNIGTIAASDVDTGDTLTYTIGGVDASLFDINASSGQITANSPASQGNYSLSIAVTDSKSPAINIAVGVTVEQVPVVTDSVTVTKADYNSKKAQLKIEASSNVADTIDLDVVLLDSNGDPSATQLAPDSVLTYNNKKGLWTATFNLTSIGDATQVRVATPDGASDDILINIGGGGGGKPNRIVGNLNPASASSSASTWLSLDSLLNDSAKRGKGVVDIIGG